MAKGKPRVHNVILATDHQDGAYAILRDPSMEGWDIVTKESQLHGLHIDQWAITEMAASNMRQFPKMLAWLGENSRRTEAMRARGEL